MADITHQISVKTLPEITLQALHQLAGLTKQWECAAGPEKWLGTRVQFDLQADDTGTGRAFPDDISIAADC